MNVVAICFIVHDEDADVTDGAQVGEFTGDIAHIQYVETHVE